MDFFLFQNQVNLVFLLFWLKKNQIFPLCRAQTQNSKFRAMQKSLIKISTEGARSEKSIQTFFLKVPKLRNFGKAQSRKSTFFGLIRGHKSLFKIN